MGFAEQAVLYTAGVILLAALFNDNFEFGWWIPLLLVVQYVIFKSSSPTNRDGPPPDVTDSGSY